jgi:hypothetical protein
MMKHVRRTPSTMILTAPVKQLAKAVYPEPLEGVLASLKFRRHLKAYSISGDTITVTVDKAHGSSLEALLSLSGDHS